MERETWLFDLAHGNLNNKQIIKGFIKLYAAFDMGISDIKRHILFHTNYGEEGAKQAITSLLEAFKQI